MAHLFTLSLPLLLHLPFVIQGCPGTLSSPSFLGGLALRALGGCVWEKFGASGVGFRVCGFPKWLLPSCFWVSHGELNTVIQKMRKSVKKLHKHVVLLYAPQKERLQSCYNLKMSLRP